MAFLDEYGQRMRPPGEPVYIPELAIPGSWNPTTGSPGATTPNTALPGPSPTPDPTPGGGTPGAGDGGPPRFYPTSSHRVKTANELFSYMGGLMNPGGQQGQGNWLAMLRNLLGDFQSSLPEGGATAPGFLTGGPQSFRTQWGLGGGSLPGGGGSTTPATSGGSTGTSSTSSGGGAGGYLGWLSALLGRR